MDVRKLGKRVPGVERQEELPRRDGYAISETDHFIKKAKLFSINLRAYFRLLDFKNALRLMG